MSAVNPPESPPRAPVIPEGLATKLGKYGALAMAVLAAFLEISHVSLDTDATLALVGGLVTLVTTIIGRMHQAAKIYEASPSPIQGATNVVDYVEDLIDGEPDGAPTYVTEADLPPGTPEVDDPAVPPGLLGGDARDSG